MNMFVLFIEFENENKDHIVKMIIAVFYSIMRFQTTWKLTLLYIHYEKNFLKIRRMRILGACIFSKFFGGKITAFSTDVTYRITIIKFKKTGACVFWAPVFFFCKFFGGKLGLRTRKTWQRKMNEFTNFSKMSVLTVCPKWKREICLDKQLLDWTLK